MESRGNTGSVRKERHVQPGNNGAFPRSERPPPPRNKMEADVESTRVLMHALREIVTSENAAKMIEFMSNQRTNGAKQAAESRVKIAEIQATHAKRTSWFFLAALVFCLTFLGVIIYWLRADKDSLLPTLSALIGLMAGTGGGYVFGRSTITGGNG